MNTKEFWYLEKVVYFICNITPLFWNWWLAVISLQEKNLSMKSINRHYNKNFSNYNFINTKAIWCFKLAILSLYKHNIYFQYDIGEWKTFFRGQQYLRLIKLLASVPLEICLVTYCYHQKSTCGVTSAAYLVFLVKTLFHLLSICYCLMENHFSEVKKTSDSFTYVLQ